MKNILEKIKRGFTMVELLVVIAIIGVIAILTIPTVLLSNNATKEKASGLFEKSVKDASNVFVKEYPDVIGWFDDNGDNAEYTCVSIKVLISKGYLSNDLKDPLTGEPYDVNKMVKIKRNKTTLVIIGEGEIGHVDCDDFYNKNGNPEIIITYVLEDSDRKTYHEGDWTNKDIIQNLRAEGKNEIVSFDISYNNGGNWSSIDNPGEVIRKEDINRDVIVRAIDQYGNEARISYRLMIDKIKPTCNISASGTMGSNNWYISDVNMILGYSDGQSGVGAYGLSNTNSVIYNYTTTMTLATNTTGMTYYGYVKDNAGNEGTCSINVKRATDGPTISLACIPTSFTRGTSYALPCSSDYGTSGGGSISCTVGGVVYTNTSSLAVGSKTITCKITSGNGKESTTSKTVTVTNPCACTYDYQCGTDYSCNGCSCYYNPQSGGGGCCPSCGDDCGGGGGSCSSNCWCSCEVGTPGGGGGCWC